MFSLISSAIKLAWLVTTYASIIIYLAQMNGYITGLLSNLFESPVPYEIVSVMWSTISTLNWILHPRIVELVMMIWLTLPAVRMIFYFTKKFVWVT